LTARWRGVDSSQTDVARETLAETDAVGREVGGSS